MSDQPSRVLWVTKGLGLGGTERLLVSTAGHLQPRRYQVEVAYVLPAKDGFVPALQGQGVAVHCLGRPPARWRWPLRLRRLALTGGFALVHTHAPVPAAAARVAMLGTSIPFVHTEHNVWERYRWPTYAINAATFGRNRAVIAVSGVVRDSVFRPWWAPWLRMPPVEVLHHGIDSSQIHRGPLARQQARWRLGVPPDAPVVGTVANFTPKKDQRVLLEAVRQELLRRPDLHLILIGTGPLEDQLRAHADELGLGSRAHFTGPREDVLELLPGFDVFALSSVHEGLSIALLEALAAGVPCVVTAVGGMPEVVTDGLEGFLVPPQDAAALAVALGKLLDDPALAERMGQRARERAEAFDIRRAAERVEGLYDEVLACR